MTDLEKNWDDLPVGPVPVDAILRTARREAAAAERRRPEARLKRSLGVVTVLGGIAAAFVAGTFVATDGPRDPAPPAAGSGAESAQGKSADAGDFAGPLDSAPQLDITPAAFHGELQAPASCGDLLDSYVERGVDLVGPYGWGGGYREVHATGAFGQILGDLRVGTTRRAPNDRFMDAPQLANARGAANSPAATTGSLGSETGTNVQEAGVDEPDSVKTDGSLLVRLRGAELTTYDVSANLEAGITELGSLDLGDFHDGEILLAGDMVVAVGNDGTRSQAYDPYGYVQTPQQTRVLQIDIADPAAPALEQTVDYDAGLVATRQHGDDVRVVLSKGLPDLDFDIDHGDNRGADGDGGASAVQTNRRLVERTTLDDWLPRVSVDGAEPTDLLDCDRVAIPRAELGLGTMAVVGFGATTPGETDALGLAGDAPLTYESADHLYLASRGSGFGGFERCFECFDSVTGGSVDGTTHLYDFALDGASATYVGAGEVEGYVRDRWSMDEADGVLRVAVGPSTETDNANSIVTLRAEGDDLVEVGRLDGLGAGEEIKAVRWFDDVALLVTFRQIDPLYAVDLSDVADPTLLGELKIPGFSSYLHPLGTMRVVGVGSDGRSGAQAGLFDVTDLTSPRQLDVTSYGRGTYAKAGDDPRQFTWLPDERIVLTVIAKGRAGFVSKIQLGGGRMRNEMTRVEFGSDVDEVRLVPVGGGKVALVTGEDVAFFPLG